MLKQYWKKGQKVVRILQKRGIVGVYYAVRNKMIEKKRRNDFQKWILIEEKTEKEREKLSYQPLISIIIPVYNVAKEQLTECIESVLNQTSENWELCIADDASSMPEVKTVLKQYEQHPKVKIVYREKNGHISRATNSAIALAAGEFIAFLDCDDVLVPDAVYEMTKKLNDGSQYDFIYSDEDKIDENGGNRRMPHFKPEWSPDTFLSHMYTCHFSIYRRSIAKEIGLLQPGYEGAQDYDFTLRFTEKTDKVGHIAKILYHWRERKESTAGDPDSKPYIYEATKKSKEDALRRRGIKASLEMIEGICQYRIVYDTVSKPLVSIFIEAEDNLRELIQCIKSIKEKTVYENFEIILIDKCNNEKNKMLCKKLSRKYDCQYMYSPEKNIARRYNTAVKRSKGEYLLFLSSQTEIKDGIWLERMLGQAMQAHTGLVGAKLVMHNKAERIISDGIIMLKQGPGNIFHGQSDHAVYYFYRNRMDYNYTAVSEKCCMISKKLFTSAGGFDERFSDVYYHIDLCCKVIERGYYNVIRNDAVLYYKGKEIQRNKQKEKKLLYHLHPDVLREDRCYNRNLSQDKTDCSIRIVSGK